MYSIRGARNSAWITGSIIDDTTIKQLYNMLASPAITGRVVIMPDTHCGKGSVIGFVMKSADKVCPNVVGVDIGCGMLTYSIPPLDFPLDEIDSIIRRVIPTGFKRRQEILQRFPDAAEMAARVGYPEYEYSIGTLGGGNHLIEIGVHDNLWYITVHTGSRHLGLKVANYHQKIAGKNPLAYLTGDAMNQYLLDMHTCQRFAQFNRLAIVTVILLELGVYYDSHFVASSVHNYIDDIDGVIRKGAISAYQWERVVIPINRTFGTIIGRGKSNLEWLCSAPHGAGRVMSRGDAKRRITQQEADAEMEVGGVYSSSNPLDESDAVYKSPATILAEIEPTVDIEFIIRPLLNIKDSEEE